MIFPEDEEFLAHYGKKGMKWGIRNSKVGKASVKRAQNYSRRPIRIQKAVTNKINQPKVKTNLKKFGKVMIGSAAFVGAATIGVALVKGGMSYRNTMKNFNPMDLPLAKMTDAQKAASIVTRVVNQVG